MVLLVLLNLKEPHRPEPKRETAQEWLDRNKADYIFEDLGWAVDWTLFARVSHKEHKADGKPYERHLVFAFVHLPEVLPNNKTLPWLCEHGYGFDTTCLVAQTPNGTDLCFCMRYAVAVQVQGTLANPQPNKSFGEKPFLVLQDAIDLLPPGDWQRGHPEVGARGRTPVFVLGQRVRHKRSRKLLHTRQWNFLRWHFFSLNGNKCRHRPCPVTSLQAFSWASPDSLKPDDICCQDTNPPLWLALSCEAASGTYRLDTTLQFPRTERWIHIVLHSLKSQFAAGLLCTILPEDMLLRGYVSVAHPDQFWVTGSLKDTRGAQRQPAGPDEVFSTWRHRLVWLIPTDAARDAEERHRQGEVHRHCSSSTPWRRRPDRSLRDARKSRDMWRAGTVHLLTAAPRTINGRYRMTFAPPAQAGGESLLLVLDYIGPTRYCLRLPSQGHQGHGGRPLAGDRPGAGGPELGPGRGGGVAEPCSPEGNLPSNLRYVNTLSDVINPDIPLPPAISTLDEQQAKVLEALREANMPCHLVHALAGTGKSRLLQAILAMWDTARQRHPGKFLLVTLRNRPLRHEFLETLLDDHILKPDEVLWGGGAVA